MNMRNEPKPATGRRRTAGRLDERKYSKYFKAFGDPTRLRILAFLSGGESTVGDIVREVGLTQPTISRHLAILRDAGIVADRRQGQQVYYSLNKTAVAGCCDGFCTGLEIRIVTDRGRKKSRKK